MSLLKYVRQRKQPNYILSAFRISAGSRRDGFLKFSTYSRLQSNAETTGSYFNTAKKTGSWRNDAVYDISRHVQDCVKRKATQEDVLGIYSRYKRNGKLSEKDSVRILFQLAKKLPCLFTPQRDAKSIEKVFNVLMEDITDKKTQLKPFQIADVFWSLGKLEVIDSEIFDHFGGLIETTTDFSGFSNRDLAMILWGHGTANIQSPLVFNIFKKEILNRGIRSFSTIDISQIVWSYAKAGKQSGLLFAAVREEIEERDITAFSNRDILMFLWAFSEVGRNVKSLFRFIKFELVNSRHRLGEYDGKELSVILWSFANQEMKALDLFTAIESELLTRPEVYLDEQSLVVIAWSFARTDNKSPRLFRFVEEKMMSENLPNWPLQRLVRILWAFNRSGFLRSKALDYVTRAMADHNFHELSQDSLEEMVFILQYCNLKISPELVSRVEEELRRRAENT